MRERACNVDHVLELVRRLGLSPADLTAYGAEDLRSANPARAGKARCVEKCWALMARLGVKYIDLPDTAGQSPDKPPSRRPGRRSAEKPQQYQEYDGKLAAAANSCEINDLTKSDRVGDLEAKYATEAIIARSAP
jgi:hypothetical protein